MISHSITGLFFAHPWGGWGHAWYAWGPGGGWPWLWGPLMLALVAAAIWLVVRARGSGMRSSTARAEQILAERYARGEISRDEYRERLDDLE
jgi:putative membrane protein